MPIGLAVLGCDSRVFPGSLDAPRTQKGCPACPTPPQNGTQWDQDPAQNITQVGALPLLRIEKS